MTVSNIQTQYGTGNSTIFSKEKQLDQNDFLRLMTAQLQQQDPFNPVNNQEMVAQMAQFSSLAGVNETNVMLGKISDQLGAQTQLLEKLNAALPTTTPPVTTPITQEG